MEDDHAAPPAAPITGDPVVADRQPEAMTGVTAHPPGDVGAASHPPEPATPSHAVLQDVKQVTLRNQNYIMAEFDWSISMTYAQVSACPVTSRVLSDEYPCYGNNFQLEFYPNDALNNGSSLRVVSLGPQHRFRMRIAVVEIYSKPNAAAHPELVKKRKWEPSNSHMGWDARVDMRDSLVGAFPLVKFAEYTTKEKRNIISYDNTIGIHVELFLYAESVLSIEDSLSKNMMSLRLRDETFDAR